MAYTWIKDHIDQLDNDILFALSDRLWRRWHELNLAAQRHFQGGQLPPVRRCAFWLHIPPAELEADLAALASEGLVVLEDDVWYVVGFQERQASAPPAERVSQHRKRNVTTPVTDRYIEETRLDIDKEEEEESESESDSLPPSPPDNSRKADEPYKYPGNAKQARSNKYIGIYQKLVGTFPGQSDWPIIIDAMRQIEHRRPREELAAYLEPFVSAYRSCTRKDGRPYNPSNPYWLTGWAVDGKIPDNSSRPAAATGLLAELEALKNGQ